MAEKQEVQQKEQQQGDVTMPPLYAGKHGMPPLILRSNSKSSTHSNCSTPRSERSASGAPKIREWDVANGPRKTGACKLTMPLAAVTRLLVFSLGSLICILTYLLAKILEKLGLVKKAVDSNVFQSAFNLWIRSNGIFPSVHFEALGEVGLELAWQLRMERAPKASEANITPVIVTNHTSYLDGPMIATIFGAPKLVAKKGTRSVPFLGHLMEEMEVIFVDRAEANSRHSTLEAIEGHCLNWKIGARPLVIFPEGTTTNGESLLPFKKGAFVAGTPVRPVIVVYTGAFDPANTTYLRTLAGGVVEMTFGEWAKQFLGTLFHTVHVRVLPPYIPSEAERKDPDLYAQGVREVMLKKLLSVRKEMKSKRSLCGRCQKRRDSEKEA